MSTHSVVILFPRRAPLGARIRQTLADVLDEVVTFERAHARLAWSVTLAGVVIGLALQSL